MRIAAIDIGTNSIHMVIAEASTPGGFEIVEREREVVQIGRGSFRTGKLQRGAVTRTLAALGRFLQLATRRQVDHVLCTATAAVREARNGGEFLAACQRECGLTPRVIPASAEGRLIYLGVRAALEIGPHPVAIVDIGGGSMQIVVADAERCLEIVSAPLGALRLTEEHLESDPASPRELERLRRRIRDGAREALETVLRFKPTRVYGSSGAIHALAHVAEWTDTGHTISQVNGHAFARGALESVTRRLQRMTAREREKLPAIDARRAEIIVAGAMVLEHVLEVLDAPAVILCDYGVREGSVMEYLGAHAAQLSAVESVPDLRMRSVLQCLGRFQPGSTHPGHVARLALALFDGLQSEHELPPEDRELLHFGALLHDIGTVVGYDGHAEYSYFMIKHVTLRGLSAEDTEFVALLALYHGKQRPGRRGSAYRALKKPRRRALRWLAAVLRIAEGLDRSHYQLVQSLRVERGGGGYAIRGVVSGAAQLELWAARERLELLSRLLDSPVRLTPEAPPNGAGANRGKRPATTQATARAARRPRPAP